MGRQRYFVLVKTVLVIVGVLTFLIEDVSAEVEMVSVDVNLILSNYPMNVFETTLRATILGMSDSDSVSVATEGYGSATLKVLLDPSMPELFSVFTIEFTGGVISFENMSFNLSFNPYGEIAVTTNGLSGTLDTPAQQGYVSGSEFEADDHVLILNNGTISVDGAGSIEYMLDTMTIDVSEDPVSLTIDGTGQVDVSLITVGSTKVTYQVVLMMPVEFHETLAGNDAIQISFLGNGTIKCVGQFTICTLHSDLAGDDCYVDSLDLVGFADEWLAYSELEPCPLAADLYGGDCLVNFADFAILASEWLDDGLGDL